MIPLAFFVSLLFLYSLLSGRLERTIVTAPIVFTVAGMLMFPALQGILRAGFTAKAALHIAEVGLVMLLFTDASRTDLNVLRNIRNLPARLLSTGMLLTILLGAVVARLVFPQLSIWEAGILSAILARSSAWQLASPADGCWASRAARGGSRNRSNKSAWSRCRCFAC